MNVLQYDLCGFSALKKAFLLRGTPFVLVLVKT